MDLTRIFSLKSRFTFSLLVVFLCVFSVGAWWAVRLLVWSEVQARLNYSADRIESSFREKLLTHGNNLVHLRSHFLLGGSPNAREFDQIIGKSDLFSRNPDLSGVGFAPLLGIGTAMHAPIRLAEPLDWRNRRSVGLDLMKDATRREALLRAVTSEEPAITEPVELSRGEGVEKGFLLFLPVQKPPISEANADPLRRTQGVIYAVFRGREFFEEVFGAPSLKNEAVNFVVSGADSAGGDKILYNRFEVTDKEVTPWAAIERSFSLYGKRLTLRIYPLAHFYSFADRYLALVVGLGAALISCLIMIVMRASQNQLDFETLAKEASMESARQSRKQLDNLRRLNEFDQTLVGELDTDALVRKFSLVVEEMADLDASFLFFKRGAQDASLPLREYAGINESKFKCESLNSAWLEKIVTQSLVLRKGAPGSQEILREVLADAERYSDWFLFTVSTREGGRCGLVFVAKINGRQFSEVEKELFESLVTQFASGAEIAQLFLRVEDASRAKNAFLANMSHEIRTPLSAILGFSEMMGREDLGPEKRHSLVDNLRKNGEQLTCIIDDILDLSKVEAGKLKINLQKTSLSSLLHDVRSVMLLRATDKNIRFTVESVGKLPSYIETDGVRLKQILMNIAGNAIKFTDTGEVRLVVRHRQCETLEHCLVFTVKDTGIGIADDMQSELFRPFSQVDTSSTRRFGGSGLGLALSKRLAQQLGGDIKLVESIHGQGSTFETQINVGALVDTAWMQTIFPRLTATTVTAKGEAPRLDGAKILVVEDSEDNQDIFRYFLESSGANAKIVGDGNEAVRTAADGDFDLILMDIQIPGIDGKEATRRIRKMGFKRPIVALTAHAMLEEQESCRKAGCVGQITKPVSGENLVAHVAAYLRAVI